MKVTQTRLMGLAGLLALALLAGGCQSGRNLSQDALVAESRGDFATALKGYTRALKAGDLSLKERAIMFTNRGNIYAKMGLYHKAMEDYNSAMESHPYYPEAYNQRGLVHGILGDYKRAVKDFRWAIKYKKQYSKRVYAEAYWGRGHAYGRMGKFSKAIDDLSAAIAAKPKYSYYYVERGLIYAEKGGYDKAKIDFDQAVTLNRHDVSPMVYKGIVFFLEGDSPAAIQQLQTAIGRNPASFLAHVWLYIVKARDYAAIHARLGIVPKLQAIKRDYFTRLEKLGGGAQGIGALQAETRAGLAGVTSADQSVLTALNEIRQEMFGDGASALAVDEKIAAVQALLDEKIEALTRPDFSAYNATLKDEKWNDLIMSMFMGELTPATLIAAAIDTDPEKNRLKGLAANFYVGQFYLINHQPERAASFFNKSLDSVRYGKIMSVAAKAELERL